MAFIADGASWRFWVACRKAGLTWAVLVFLGGSVQPTGLHAQPQAPGVRYEAASIKPSKSTDLRRHGMEFLPGGHFRSINMPMLPVLATAYNIPFQSIETFQQRMKGIPDWVLSEPYDIEVRAEEAPAARGTPVPLRYERIRLMLQSMLVDRLRLKIRREIAEAPAYALVAGPRLKLVRSKVTETECAESAPFGGTGCHQFQGGAGRGIRGLAVDLSDLAAHVSNWSDRPVVDETALTGLYEIQTEGWAQPGSDDGSRRSLDEVLDGLGLRRNRKKAKIEILFVEHIERPSAN